MNDGLNLGVTVEAVQGDALTYPAAVLAVQHAPRTGGPGAQKSTTLPFDVHGERIVIYDKIYRLKPMLDTELKHLLD